MAFLGRFVFSLVFGAAGMFLLWATQRAIQRRRRWLLDGVVVDGEVVDLKKRSRAASRAGRSPLAPVIEYRSPLGEVRRFTSREAAVPSPFVVGQRVRVRYIAGDPGEAELGAVVEGWTFFAATATLALACLAAASVPIIVTAREIYTLW
jgi:hypothetical protein